MGVGALCSLSIEHLPTEVDLGCHVCGVWSREQQFSRILCCSESNSMSYSEFTTLCSIHGSLQFSSVQWHDIRPYCRWNASKPREINFTQIVCQFLLDW